VVEPISAMATEYIAWSRLRATAQSCRGLCLQQIWPAADDTKCKLLDCEQDEKAGAHSLQDTLYLLNTMFSRATSIVN
jgi:hypothetical protein